MPPILVSYLAALLSFLAIDGAWLALMAKRFYAARLGELMASSPKLGPIILFYLLYPVAVAVLIAAPSVRDGSSLASIFLRGALLGLAAYGTYNLTNHGTMKGWPLIVTVVDMSWGAALTGVVSVIAALAARRLS